MKRITHRQFLASLLATLALLAAPALGVARVLSAPSAGPPTPALTGEPAAASASGGYTIGSAPAGAGSSSPTPSEPAARAATTGPPPPPTRRPIPCPLEWCQKLIEQFCHRFDCAKLSSEFRGTASHKSRVARRALHSDAAFQPPWNGVGFAVHHIVAQGNPYNGVADFAQWLLRRVGLGADDPANLAALRGSSRERGTAGYAQLAADPALQGRMAHSDTLAKYYYQRVNERFAQWIRGHGGHLPDRAQVRAILHQIKAELYAGGTHYIKSGVIPRARDTGA